jgi:hypothetical protein
MTLNFFQRPSDDVKHINQLLLIHVSQNIAPYSKNLTLNAVARHVAKVPGSP